MIELPFFAELPVAVLGLGRSGLAAAKALKASGAYVHAWDDDPDARHYAGEAGVPIVDLAQEDWRSFTTLVLSPGIPHTHPAPHPLVAQARAAGCEVIGDVELLGRARPSARYCGVTGTNGKSTTTALIGHILQLAGREVEVGGNIGRPALELGALGPDETYVLEMSSYQLELTLSITFDVAVLLNISLDHLERHGGLEGYIGAKRLIFHRQTSPRTAIVGIDDPHSRRICEELVRVDDQVVWPISAESRPAGGVHAVGGQLVDATGPGPAVPVLDLRQIPSLPGQHNWQNAAAAYAAAKALGVEPPIIAACLQSFPGLPHRQERLELIDGVLFVNDSKATNAEAAARALACYDAIYWIAGGRAKTGGIEGLEIDPERIRAAFLIGEAEPAFAKTLQGRVPVERCGTLETAVAAAFERAKAAEAERPTVLLSPAAASFDQFADFEARGEVFRRLVASLPGQRGDPDGAREAVT